MYDHVTFVTFLILILMSLNVKECSLFYHFTFSDLFPDLFKTKGHKKDFKNVRKHF